MPSLYANIVSSNAVIQPNNNTSLYNPLGGNTIPVNGNINANNINVSNNVHVGGQVSATGNIVTAGYFIGDGSQLSNIAGSYGNANVAAFLPTYTGNLAGNNIALTGAAVVTGNITTGGFYFGNGSQLTGITADYSNANVAEFLPTYSGNISAGNVAVVDAITGANIFASGQISATGDISTAGNLRTLGAQGNIVGANYVSSNFFVGDGSLLTNVTATGNYSNSNVTALMAAFGSNTISTTGNISSGFFLGNGSQLTGIAASYGNANVVTLLADLGSNAISTTGNITAGFFIGNGSQLTGLPAGYSNADVNSHLAAFGSNVISTTGNVTAGYFVGNGSLLTNITGANVSGQVANALVSGTVYVNAQPNITSVGTLTSLSATGNVTGGNLNTAGNVSGSYILGDGSQLTNLPGNIANITANVISFNTAAGINVTAGQMAWNSADGTLDIGLGYGNVVLQTGQETHYVVRNETGNAISNGTAVYCSGVTPSGRISVDLMTSNIDPVQFLGLATQDISNGVNGIVTWFGYVRDLDTRGTANTAISVGDETWAAGDKLYVHPTAAGKLTNVEPAAPNVKICVASIMIRNQTSGVLFVRPTTNLTAADLSDVQITTPATNQFLVYAGNRWENTALDISLDTSPTLGGNLAGAGFDISNVSNISATGNITVSNLNMSGQIYDSSGVLQLNGSGNIVFAPTGTTVATGNLSATGNITGSYFLGNGSQLTGISASPGGNTTEIQFNNSGAFAGNAQMTFNTATGNVTLGNLVITSANTSGNSLGLTSVNSYQSNATPNPGRINVGSGKNGDWTNTADITTNSRGSRMWIADEYIRYDNGVRNREFAATSFANLAGGNVGTANANSRMGGMNGEVYVLNGNSVSTTVPYVSGVVGTVAVGQSANTANATLAAGCGILSFILVNAGSSAGNLVQYSHVSTFNGNVANWIGYSGGPGGSANVSGNAIGFFHPGVTATVTSLTTPNIVRTASNYFSFRSDDDLAQSRLGMLSRFHELNANTANTSGTVDISKNSGQVQTIYPTGNVTVGSFTNFVTRVAAPNGTQVNTADTVTVIIQQGATPYSITMPTGNTQIRYAGGLTAVAATANTTTMISITGVYDYNTAGNEYLITISPEFS